ncbi:MAG TPA: NAD(P)-dependent oxidoreductase [Chloroflexota bacterium]|nr:NAD(P)-dependent oxidoreductase [Chloroflexota bacterium]
MVALVVGAGYIGAALAESLCAGGQDVVAFDNGFATDWPALEALARRWGASLRVHRGDLRDRNAVDSAFAAAGTVEVVFLLAAQASAHPDAAPAEYTETTNLQGPRIVLDAAMRHGKPPVVYGSSFHVYGSGLTGAVDETRPYGRFRDLSHLSKVYVEKLGEMYAGLHGVGFAPVRLGIVYGVSPVTKRDLRFVTVPHAFCLRTLAGETLRVNPSGMSPIGFIHLDDAVSALRCAASGLAYAPANAVSEFATAADVARTVRRVAQSRGYDVQIDVPEQPAVAHQTVPQVTSRLTETGWSPRRSLSESIDAIFDHYATTLGAAERHRT